MNTLRDISGSRCSCDANRLFISCSFTSREVFLQKANSPQSEPTRQTAFLYHTQLAAIRYSLKESNLGVRTLDVISSAVTKTRTWVLFLLVIPLLTACNPLVSQSQKTTVSSPYTEVNPTGALPHRALFTLCHLGNTIAIIDANNWTVTGRVTHPEIRSVSDLALNHRGLLYLTRDGDLGEVSETLIPLVPTTGEFLDYITLSAAPFRIAISPSGLAVVTHVAIWENGRTRVSFVDTNRHRLLDWQWVEGSATFVEVMEDKAFVLVTAWTEAQENHLLVYDLENFSINKRYALPAGDVALDGDFVVSADKVYYIAYVEAEKAGRSLSYEIVELNLETGRVRIIARLPSAGELGLLSNGDLIVSSGGYDPDQPLRLVDGVDGEILQELFIGRNASIVQPVGDDLFAIHLDDDNELVIIDGGAFEEIERISSPCQPFVLRMHFANAAKPMSP